MYGVRASHIRRACEACTAYEHCLIGETRQRLKYKAFLLPVYGISFKYVFISQNGSRSYNLYAVEQLLVDGEGMLHLADEDELVCTV